MPVVEPHSELKIRIGLMMMAPHHKTEIKGHFPDKEIIPTLEDRLKEMTPNSAGY
jgi:hypothetical protein